MAVFYRSSTPPQFQSHRSYKRFLRFDFQFRGAYCETTEVYLHGSDVFGADHFRPYKVFPELDCVYDNLYYCCNRCNSYKGPIWPTEDQQAKGFVFIDPCVEDPYAAHISLDPSGSALPITSAGAFTVRIIRLDREECRRFRTKREQVRSRIQEYQAVLTEAHEPSMIADLLRSALAEAEAEWAEIFAPESHSRENPQN